ncbi:MAG: hypothetical protein JRH18_21545 [Deltaproteobacteria bacterium]|nr:hypothetical protein [Deltaproteobacteria bacterium]MBW1962612.1 hypothetical protein [Deltaproteobacteria bacterium]MBW2154237.1 hypothetical protein [Deltaproteobacteria bacterium]
MIKHKNNTFSPVPTPWVSEPVLEVNTYQRITDVIWGAVAKGCDALFPAVHGIKVSQSTSEEFIANGEIKDRYLTLGSVQSTT